MIDQDLNSKIREPTRSFSSSNQFRTKLNRGRCISLFVLKVGFGARSRPSGDT